MQISYVGENVLHVTGDQFKVKHKETFVKSAKHFCLHWLTKKYLQTTLMIDKYHLYEEAVGVVISTYH